jgi:hypothetical protein
MIFGVISETFLDEATPRTPNLEKFQILMDNANKFYGI